MAEYEPYKALLDFPIIHGRYLCNEVLSNTNNKDRPITISDDIQILTVVDAPSRCQSLLDNTFFTNAKVHTIVIDEYVKWISKIKHLKEYIEAEYDNLPSYILYVDAFDTLIQQDILEPQKILDFYDCKMLFNMEANYSHTGFPGPTHEYFDPLYYREAPRCYELSEKKFGSPVQCALNAGVFLGEKQFTLQILTEALNYMLDDFTKGYPYGCLDDQCLLRFIHNEHFNNISVDLFNKFCFWGTVLTFEDLSDNNIFGVGHTQKYLKKYIDGKH
jgi:hypothetical protein